MMARNPVPDNIQNEVLLRSRRRCCICFALNNDLGEKRGQIAHLDKNNANSDLDNLAFLCLVHHDEYDSTTSQRKGLREGEVKQFRKELYDRIVAGLPGEVSLTRTSEDRPSIPSTRPERLEEILPNLGSLRPEIIHITYDDEADIWLKSNLLEGEIKDVVCIALPFSNDSQSQKKTLPLEGLRARLTYYRGDTVQEFKRIDSGCWIGAAYRSVTLEVGGIAYLIAAVSIDGRSGVIENPRQTFARYNQDVTVVDRLPNGTYEVKVNLVGGDNGEYSEEYWFELEVGEQMKGKRISPFPVR